MRNFGFLVAIGGFLAGCVSPEQAAKMRVSIARHVTCQGQQACAASWARAIDWVQSQSSMHLLMQTDYTLEAGEGDETVPGLGPPIRITITKSPIGPSGFEFIFRLRCVDPRVCMGLEMIGDEASFKDYMLGPV